MTDLHLRQMPVTELRPAPYNPRRPLSARAHAKLKASLERFGLVEPLVWNETSGHLVGGHARFQIVKELGWDTVPVSVVRLSVAEEKALNVILNNQEAQGRYDPGKLADLLSELEDLPEFDFTGFDATTLRSLRLEPVPDLESEVKAEEFEITLVVPASRYEALTEELDALIARHDLVSHVRQRSPSSRLSAQDL